jgi:hypothetical protein
VLRKTRTRLDRSDAHHSCAGGNPDAGCFHRYRPHMRNSPASYSGSSYGMEGRSRVTTQAALCFVTPNGV